MNNVQELIGKISDIEKNELQQITKQINSFTELAKSISSKYLTETEQKKLQNLLKPDYEALKGKYGQWWSDLLVRYKWPVNPEECIVNFKNNEVYRLK